MSIQVRRRQAGQGLVYRHIWRMTRRYPPYMAYAILGNKTSWLTEDLLVEGGPGEMWLT